MQTYLEKHLYRYQAAKRAENRSRRFLYWTFDHHPVMDIWSKRDDGSLIPAVGISNRLILHEKRDNKMIETKGILVPNSISGRAFNYPPIRSLFRFMENDKEVQTVRLSWYTIGSVCGPVGQLSMHRKLTGQARGDIVIIDETPMPNTEEAIHLWNQIRKDHSVDIPNITRSIWDLDRTLFISIREI